MSTEPSLIEKLGKKGVGFQSLSDGINTTNSTGKLVLHIIGAIAEFERNLISERTCAGMEAARRRGKSIGRPYILNQQQVFRAQEQLITGTETLPEIAAQFGCSKDTLIRAFKRFGLNH